MGNAITRSDVYLNAIETGDNAGLPIPVTKHEKYLYEIAINGASAAEHYLEMEAELAKKATKGQGAHYQSTLINNWQAINGIGVTYSKNDVGMVTLIFYLKAGTANVNDAIAILPSGYRPRLINTIVQTYSPDSGSVGFGLYIDNSSGNVSVNVPNFLVGETIFGQVTYLSESGV